MRTTPRFILLVAIACTTSCSLKQETRYQHMVDAVIEQQHFPGMVLYVKKLNASGIAIAGGYSDIERKEKMTPSALFQIGSTTKLITAVSIFQLIDEQKLSIDGKVIDILDSSIVGRIPYIRQITVKHLLNHTSGIYGTNNNLEYINTLIGSEAANKRIWRSEELIALAYQGRNEPFGKPDEGTFYGDVNYILLGLIVEKISGYSLKDYVKKSIFERLNLQHTLYITDIPDFEKAKPNETAEEYLHLSKEIKDFINVHEKFVPLNDSLVNTSAAPEQIDAAGGILSNVDDLGTLGEAVFNGEFLSAESMSLLYEFSNGIEKVKVNKSKQGVVRAINKEYGVLFVSEGDGAGGGNTVLAYHPASRTIIVGHVNIFGYFTEKETIIDRVIPALID